MPSNLFSFSIKFVPKRLWPESVMFHHIVKKVWPNSLSNLSQILYDIHPLTLVYLINVQHAFVVFLKISLYLLISLFRLPTI